MRKETTEEKKYVAPEVRVIDIAANALICTSASAQSEGYEDGDITGWYN